MTVSELMERLKKLNPDLTVSIGICDDECNQGGGLFLDAQDLVLDPNCVQITAWARVHLVDRMIEVDA